MTGKRQTKPKTGEGRGKTDQTRIYKDVAEMVSWIVQVKGGTSASLLDPLIRDAVTVQYKALEKEINLLKAARRTGGD